MKIYSPWMWIKVGFFIWIGGFLASTLFNITVGFLGLALQILLRSSGIPV